jgi:hypothetical protein
MYWAWALTILSGSCRKNSWQDFLQAKIILQQDFPRETINRKIPTHSSGRAPRVDATEVGVVEEKM